jgi:hypothetical protein
MDFGGKNLKGRKQKILQLIFYLFFCSAYAMTISKNSLKWLECKFVSKSSGCLPHHGWRISWWHSGQNTLLFIYKENAIKSINLNKLLNVRFEFLR